jgi:phenylalanyl-tRNA synthetase beta chain
MKVPIRWLQDYVEIEAGEQTVARLAERLTLAGLEVEDLARVGAAERIVVGRVVTCEPHPDSDHLSLCSVDVGTETVDLVCGAANVRSEILVPVALVGARLPGGLSIEKRKVRGHVSNGMICSKAELELEDHSEGIWILDERLGLKVGDDLLEHLEYDDYVFDFKVTSNRPDCASVYGVAREVAAILDRPLLPLDTTVEETPPDAASQRTIQIESADDTPRYALRLMEDVEIGPSPLRIQHRLIKAGMRPLSNVVDVTNYVMLELGQPMHPFDADEVRGTVGIRRGRAGERLTTLDGVDRVLDPDVLTITEDDRPIALAGLMGGEKTEIRPETTRVLLEIAVFQHQAIRRSSRSIGLRTEASQRFERGLDPESVPLAAARAAHWIQATSGCRVLSGLADAYPRPAQGRKLRVRPGRAAAVLGINLDGNEIVELLSRLQIPARKLDEEIEAEVPSYRGDLEREIDLIEEIGRIRGHDRLMSRPPHTALRVGRKDGTELGKDAVRRILVGLGMDEVLTDGFDKAGWRSALGVTDSDLVKVRNPMAATQAAMRGSLLPGLLSVVETNLNRGVDGGMLFELGRIFSASKGERDALAGVVFGRTGLPLSGKEKVSLPLVKGILDRLLAQLLLADVRVEADSNIAYLHPGRSAQLRRSGESIGFFGELDPGLLERFAVPTVVYLFEFELPALLAERGTPIRYRPLPVLPAAKRDLSLTVPSEIAEARVREAIQAEAAVESILLYDVYSGEQVGAGKKSLTYELALRVAQRTLTDPEIAEIMERISRRLGKIGVQLRVG